MSIPCKWDLLTEQPDYPRDRWGRPLITPPGQNRRWGYTRASGLGKLLEDTYNLNRWKTRQAAVGLALRADLILGVLAAREDKEALNAIVDSASDAAASDAAGNTGTALHALCMLQIGGRLDTTGIAPEHLQTLAAIADVLADFDVIAIEFPCVLDEYKVAGRGDFILRHKHTGTMYIADLKTNQNLDFGGGGRALQLAAYSRSTLYRIDKQQRGPNLTEHVDQDRGLIIHAPSGAGIATPHWIDIANGWKSVPLACEVREWRRLRCWETPCAEGELTSRGDLLGRLIAAALDVDELTALWRNNRSEWTEHHTELAKARTVALT